MEEMNCDRIKQNRVFHFSELHPHCITSSTIGQRSREVAIFEYLPTRRYKVNGSIHKIQAPKRSKIIFPFLSLLNNSNTSISFLNAKYILELRHPQHLPGPTNPKIQLGYMILDGNKKYSTNY